MATKHFVSNGRVTVIYKSDYAHAVRTNNIYKIYIFMNNSTN